MSIAILNQVHEESRRLAIAGAAVASGDFRLKKLVPMLEQAGVKAPVFARVAQAARAVVESDEQTAAGALLELASIVQAILHTQGQTGAQGELRPIATVKLEASQTQTSARVLRPLLEALQTTGPGRLGVIEEAIGQGTFKDLRLVKPAIAAIDDPYPEIAALIRTKVLPMYGKAIVPDLRAKLDLKGKAGHVQRLQLLHAIDPDGSRELVHRALEEGSKEVRVAAVGCLQTTGDDLGLLLEQAKSKAKDVRAAALVAMSRAEAETEAIVGAMKQAIDGADLELIIDGLADCKLEAVHGYVLERASEQLRATLPEKDAKAQATGVARLECFLQALRRRRDARSEAFLLECYEAVPRLIKIKSMPRSGLDCAEVLCFAMARGSPVLQRALAAGHEALSSPLLEASYEAARATMHPTAFFETFSPLLEQREEKRGKAGSARERVKALGFVLRSGVDATSGDGDVNQPADAQQPVWPKLDPRWLDASIGAENMELVCELARPGHEKVARYLEENLWKAKPADRNVLLRAMIRIKHPGATDAMVEAIKREAKASPLKFHTYELCSLIPELPQAAFASFEVLLRTLPQKAMVDLIFEPVWRLGRKSE